MRPDFIKVYNTPARDNRGAEDVVKGGRLPRDLDDLPKFVGISDGRRRGWERKERACKRSAIVRWLRAQVGRPWNDVWSDICRVSDSRSGSSRPLREHVSWHVELHTHIAPDGTIRDNRHGGHVGGLYVDPDGVLRYKETKRHRYVPRVDPDVVQVDRYREFHRLDGLWYEVLYEDLPESEPIERIRPDGTVETVWTSPSAYDVVRKTTVYRRQGVRWDKGATRHAYAKRALSRKELKANGLVNDPDAKAPKNRRRRGERH